MTPDDQRAHAADRQDFARAASFAAHELAGPLSTATVALELLASRLDRDDATASDLVATAVRQLRIAQLQSSRLGQLAHGPRAPQTTPTDLRALAHEIVDDLVLSDLAHHPTFVESDGPVEAPVDPDQIRQALYNLLSNAAHYSPRGRTIVVDVSEDPGHAYLRVRDQGHGVSPEFADRIFEPYQREQRDHVMRPGLGLGLAISRAIARGHGGDLTLEPAPKGGAEFLLSLPRYVPGSVPRCD